jgi:DNA-binding transcriptional regulator of glucitol operon
VILIAVALGWVLQLGMAWRQAKRFSAVVGGPRRGGGKVSVGTGKRRLRKAYVALASDGTAVTRALVPRGVTTFADAREEPALAGEMTYLGMGPGLQDRLLAGGAVDLARARAA